MRPVATLQAQVVAREVEAFGREQFLRPCVRQLHPLELEEEQLRLKRRAPLAHQLHEGAVRGVLGVGGEAQMRVAPGAAGQLGDLGEPRHRLDEAGAVELPDVPLIGARKRLGELLGAIE